MRSRRQGKLPNNIIINNILELIEYHYTFAKSLAMVNRTFLQGLVEPWVIMLCLYNYTPKTTTTPDAQA